MPAILLLSLALVLTVVMAIDRRYRRRRAQTISELGRPMRMHYAAVDRFGLTPRLIAEPAWRGLAPGIEVKDVLYTSAGGERCFILTAKSRLSPDAPSRRTLVRFIESIADGQTRELTTRASASVADDVEGYRDLIDGWQRRRAAGQSSAAVLPDAPGSIGSTKSANASASDAAGSSSASPR